MGCRIDPRRWPFTGTAARRITGEALAELVRRSAPRIALAAADGADYAGVRITPSQMQAGEAEIVAERLVSVLSAEREEAVEPAAPAADLTGHWRVEVQYYASTVEHEWIIEQEGRWIGGQHRSAFATQALRGTIEGDEVRLASTFHQPGNTIPFLFSGVLVGKRLRAIFT